MKFPTTLQIWFAGLLLVCASGLMLLADARYDVVQMWRIELAADSASLFAIIAQNGYSVDFLKKCLYLDFMFLSGFTVVFICSARWLFRKSKVRNWAISLALLPGILDAIENTLLLIMLDHPSRTSSLFLFYHASAIVKSILVLPCIGMGIWVLVQMIRRWSGNSENNG